MADTEYTYMVLTDKSIYHEGDERSRTHPGHGYPAYTETVTTAKEFKDRRALVDWVVFQEKSRQRGLKVEPYRVFKCTPVPVNARVVLDFGD